MSRFGTERLVMPALWFAAVPAAHAVAQAFQLAGRWTGRAWLGGVIVSGLLLAGLIVASPTMFPLADRALRGQALPIGLGPEREAVLASLQSHTTAEARILWEDGVDWPDGGGWTALLAVLTGRAYLGGLDPDGWIEHSHATLKRGVLAGRPVEGWSDAEL